MSREIGLFDDIIDEIVDIENKAVDDKYEIHIYTLKDGTTYEVPFEIMPAKSIEVLMESLLTVPKFSFPRDAYGIEKMCTDMIDRMKKHLQLKELYRFILTLDKLEGKDPSELLFLKKTLDFSEECIKKNSQLAAKLAPLWFGHSVPGLPHYSGGNPYNIHGVDHKDDYLLTEDQQYFAGRRDLILTIALANKPYIPSEKVIYDTSELSNVTKEKKGGKKTIN